MPWRRSSGPEHSTEWSTGVQMEKDQVSSIPSPAGANQTKSLCERLSMWSSHLWAAFRKKKKIETTSLFLIRLLTDRQIKSAFLSQAQPLSLRVVTVCTSCGETQQSIRLSDEPVRLLCASRFSMRPNIMGTHDEQRVAEREINAFHLTRAQARTHGERK